MHIEKKSLLSMQTAAASESKANVTHSRRVDLSEPAPNRVPTCTSSGKHIKVIDN